MTDKKVTKPDRELVETEMLQGFMTAYEELCLEWGFRIAVVPGWRSTNHGTFELLLQWGPERLPEVAGE